MDYHFDFYNYAGIHRPVTLYAVPADAAITDITLTTDVTADHKLARVKFEVLADVANEIDSPNLYCLLRLRDKTAKVVAEAKSCRGIMKVKSPHLWWPHLMSSDPGYLHDLEVAIVDSKRNATLDQYTTKVGIRSLTWDNSTIRVNHADFYFKGFGKHEDADIRGKGLDLPLVAKDFNLINWIGANAFRTSHYPYAEEIMDFADANGIVVVDECPAVALDHFAGNDELVKNHKEALDRLVSRDKNRPSVFSWSVANEPRSNQESARPYFKVRRRTFPVKDPLYSIICLQEIIAHAKTLDPSRPITVVVNSYPHSDKAHIHADIVGVNRYFGWYQDTGHTELIARQMFNHLKVY